MALLKQLFFWESQIDEDGEEFDKFISLYENLMNQFNHQIKSGLMRANKERKTCFTAFNKNKSRSANKSGQSHPDK